MLGAAPILHFSVVVDDLDRSVAFYRAALGFLPALGPLDLGDAFARLTGQPGVSARLVQLAHPDRSEILEFIACTGQAGAAAGAVPIAHVALQVSDLDAAVAEAEAEGAERMGEIVTFEGEGRSAYLRAPGGSALELEEFFP
jgi:catechol 2,3-dioxygenase-like lactoylglutathione lyase family enzyme